VGGRRSGEVRKQRASTKEAEAKHVLQQNEAPPKQGRSPLPSPIPIPEEQDQDQRADARHAIERPSVRVLTKLAHELKSELSTDEPIRRTEFEELLKCRAARDRVAYDSTSIAKAVNSAEFQNRLRATS
jgi:hypothetical protein